MWRHIATRLADSFAVAPDSSGSVSPAQLADILTQISHVSERIACRQARLEAETITAEASVNVTDEDCDDMF